MPLIEMVGGDACKVFAVGNDISSGVQQLIEFPVGAPPIKKFASFAEMTPIGTGFLSCVI
jgi:hypothetical protein